MNLLRDCETFANLRLKLYLGADVGGQVEGVVLAPAEEGGQSLANLAAVPLYTRESEDLQDPLRF